MVAQIILNITLIGTEGQLDKPETNYNVRYFEDALKEATKEAVKQIGNSDFGWTYIVGIKNMDNRIYSIKELESMTRGQLLVIAKQESIVVSPEQNKDDLLAEVISGLPLAE